jgi:hypothetical protein
MESRKKTGTLKASMSGSGESDLKVGNYQGQRIALEIKEPRGRDTLTSNGRVKRYAELIGNYEKPLIKSSDDNNTQHDSSIHCSQRGRERHDRRARGLRNIGFLVARNCSSHRLVVTLGRCKIGEKNGNPKHEQSCKAIRGEGQAQQLDQPQRIGSEIICPRGSDNSIVELKRYAEQPGNWLNTEIKSLVDNKIGSDPHSPARFSVQD